MAKVKIYKCKICSEDILFEDLHQEEKRDKNKEIKLNAKGVVQYWNYHEKCHQEKMIEWNQWCELYDYVLEKYFLKTVPTSFIKQLRELRKNYTFEIILKCLQSIEGNLMKNMENKDFEGSQKGSYLNVALSNNVDAFYEKTIKKCAEVNNLPTEEFRFIDNSRSKNKEEQNYDLLD